MVNNEKRTLNIRALMVDELSGQLTGIKKELARAADATKKANEKAAKSWRRLKVAAAAVAAVYGAIKAIQLARSVAADVDRIGKLAVATGATAEEVSELAAAFEFAGGSAESFGAVLSSVLSSQRGAINGSKEQAAAFEKFGISIEELKRANPAQVLALLSRGYSNISDQTDRQLQFAALFPEQWKNVINLVEGGVDRFDERLRQAREAGATVSSEQARNAAEVTDAFFKVDLAIGNLQRQLLEVFGPSLTLALTGFAEALNRNKAVVQALGELILRVVGSVARGVTTFVVGTLRILENAGLLGLPGTDESRGALDAQRDALVQAREDLLQEYASGAPAIRPDGTSLADELNQANAKLQEFQDQWFAGTQAYSTQIVQLQQGIRTAISRLQSERVDTAEGAAFEQGQKAARDFLEGFSRESNRGNGSNPISNFFNMVREATTEGSAAFKRWNEEARKAKEAAPTFDKSWTEATKRVAAEIDNLGSVFGRELGQAATRTLDAWNNELANVITGAKTAKEAWRDFLNQTLQLVARLIAKLATLKLIETVGSTLQFEKGGVLQGVGSQQSVPMRAYADGGIARRPQLALFGEGDRAEAFVPLPDNRSIPVSFTGNSGPSGQGAVVNLNVYAWDSKDAARGLVENQDTVLSILQNGAETRNRLRQTIQRAAR